MGVDTKIQWADHTFNPWRGCTKVSPGCTNCYAESLSHRNPAVLGEWGPNGKRVVAAESAWREPIKWDKAANRDGVRRRVFCASLADVFEDRDELRGPRSRLAETIKATPHLDWLLLTKRPENIGRLGTEAFGWDVTRFGMPLNVWLGTSTEDQARADSRFPLLRQTPATVHFLSVEPLLGPIDMRPYIDLIDWVIVGGESGTNARPCDISWIRSIASHCKDAGVPVFVKQLGSRPTQPLAAAHSGPLTTCYPIHKRLDDPKGGNPDEWPEDLRVRQLPDEPTA
jgi:protein gp37